MKATEIIWATQYLGLLIHNDYHTQLAGTVRFDQDGPSDDLRRRTREVVNQAGASASC